MSDMLSEALAIALLATIFALLLKNLGWKGAPVLTSLAMIGIISLFSDALSGIFSSVEHIAYYADVSEYCSSALKILCAGYLSGIISDVCSELGEGGIAKSVTLCGRLEIILIALPYFDRLLTAAMDLLSA